MRRYSEHVDADDWAFERLDVLSGAIPSSSEVVEFLKNPIYFWISVPLTHHYKKCPVMWTIIGSINENPEISLSSRNNPEMSQCSLDLPMLANFSIYIFPNIFSELAGIIQIIKSPLTTMLIKYQKLLRNRNCLNFLMFLQGVEESCEYHIQVFIHTSDEIVSRG